jgi:hypothetical protein
VTKQNVAILEKLFIIGSGEEDALAIIIALLKKPLHCEG